jgi:hypothetical protein
MKQKSLQFKGEHAEVLHFPSNLQREFVCEELHDKILVYRNLLPETNLLADLVLRSEKESDGQYVYSKWGKWFEFGTITGFSLDGDTSDFGKSETDRGFWEYFLHRSLTYAAESAFNHYIEHYQVELPGPVRMENPGLAKYVENGYINRVGNVMNFHTDYAVGEWWWPGEKFLLTCTTYLNDNYKGGEILFLTKDCEIVEYKPVKGDIIVFPSGSPIFPKDNPYFHAVKAVTSGDKILVRTYLKYFDYSHLDKWKAMEEAHGEEEWKQIAMEQARGCNILTPEDVDESFKQGKICANDLVMSMYKLD